MVERAVILVETRTITEEELNLDLNHLESSPQQDSRNPQEFCTMSLKELESQYIQKIWTQEKKSVTKTCDILKINRSTLWRKLKEIDNTLQ